MQNEAFLDNFYNSEQKILLKTSEPVIRITWGLILLNVEGYSILKGQFRSMKFHHL